MNDEVKALVSIEVPDPFDGVVLAHVIEKHDGAIYSKTTLRWTDEVDGRNFYFDRGFYWRPELSGFDGVGGMGSAPNTPNTA